MPREYTHEGLNNEVRFIAGYYLPEEEKRFDYNGREILYVIGCAEIDNSCCGVGGCRYALVPGYIVEWKSRRNESGKFVSKVESIRDESSRVEVAKIIGENEVVTQIDFW